MGRNFLARIPFLGTTTCTTALHLLVEQPDLGLQLIQLFLLSENRSIELVQQVFSQTQLAFQMIDTFFHASTRATILKPGLYARRPARASRHRSK
ncbi:MAG: hypothetical protein H6R19_3288 [Proteobacteria bacterium]|nr:hypothetical protein [Pseudomonadota bacterium]